MNRWALAPGPNSLANSLNTKPEDSDKVNHPILAETIHITQSVALKLNNREQIELAANKIHEMGVRFGTTVIGEELVAIDSFVLPKNKHGMMPR